MNKYSKVQLSSLVFLRMIIGWHLLYEGLVKLLSSGWSSASFLGESQWIFSGLARWIISHDGVLQTVDVLNTWGLIAIGAGLILGLFSRIAAISGAVLLLMYYFNNPPFIGMEYSVPTEGSYLIVSKTLIEAIALWVVALFPTSKQFGLDYFIKRLKKQVYGN